VKKSAGFPSCPQFFDFSIHFYPFLPISGLGHHAPWHLSFRGLRSSRRPCTRWRAGTTGGTACAKRCWSCGRSFWRKGPGRAWMPWRSGWSPMWRTRSWLLSNIVVQCEAPKIAKLVNITPITMVYGTYNYSNLDVENVNGEWWCSRFMDDFFGLFLLDANINSRQFMDINCSSLSDPCDHCSRSRQNPGSRAGRQQSADTWIFINRRC